MSNTSLIEPGQCLSAGAAAVVAVDLESSGQDSAAEQGFNRTNEAVGAAAHAFSGTGANGDITIHGGAAAVKALSDDEALEALAADGKLIKRPFVEVNSSTYLTGFKPDLWESALQG